MNRSTVHQLNLPDRRRHRPPCGPARCPGCPARPHPHPEFGQLSYYSTGPGQGRPLVLIHSINAAPSAYEMKPLFDHYRSERPVLAPDLPGFGFSDRPDIPTHPDVFVKALVEFLRQVVVQPADLVALSLGGEFAARVASEVAGTGQLAGPDLTDRVQPRTMPGGEKGMRLSIASSACRVWVRVPTAP